MSAMDRFRAMLGGRQNNLAEAPESVLGEWQKYSTDSAPPTQSDRLLGQMEAGGASLSNAFSSSLNAARSGISSAGATIGGGASSATSFMPSAAQFTYFAVFMGSGVFFVFIAVTMFLPVIILAPAKFASAFTLGSSLIMASFFALKGFQAQLKYMMEKERLLFSIGYIGSMGATLYAALIMHSYIMSLACCGIQVVALLYYLLSYFPGGTASMRYIGYMVWSAVTSCFSGIMRTAG